MLTATNLGHALTAYLATHRDYFTLQRRDDEEKEELFQIRRRKRLEKQMEREIQAALEAQLAEAIGSRMTIDESIHASDKIKDDDNRLRNALIVALFAAVILGMQSGEQQLQGRSLFIDSAQVLGRAREWARTYSYDLVRQLNDTSRQQIRNAVADWIGSGRNVQSLIDELSPVFGQRRAAIIARTEITRAFNVAMGETMREAGIEMVQWFTTLDERVCPFCRPMHGLQRPINGIYPPGSPITFPPPAHVGCRCGELGVVETQK